MVLRTVYVIEQTSIWSVASFAVGALVIAVHNAIIDLMMTTLANRSIQVGSLNCLALTSPDWSVLSGANKAANSGPRQQRMSL